MNQQTGEVTEIAKKEKPKPGWIPIRIGEIVDIKGVPCKLTAINAGKRRLSFTVIGTDAKFSTLRDPKWPAK
jgi:hypothetical protein